MISIQSNFTSNTVKCLTNCNENESQKHIFYCKKLNDEIPTQDFDEIYGEKVNIQTQITYIFEKNIEKYKKWPKWTYLSSAVVL